MLESIKKYFAKQRFLSQCRKFGVCSIHFTLMSTVDDYDGWHYFCQQCHDENTAKHTTKKLDADNERADAAQRLRKLAEAHGY